MDKNLISTGFEEKFKTLEKKLEAKTSQCKALHNANTVMETQIERLSADLELTRQHLETESAEHERLKTALADCEEKYRTHFKNVTEVIYTIDTRFRIRNISPAVEREWGYKPDELIGKPFADLEILTPKSLETASSNAMRVFAGDAVPPATYEFIAKDGSIRHGEVITAPVIENGAVVGIVSVAKNMTERRRIEEEILEKQKLQGVIEMARTVAYELNQPIQAIFSHAELMMMELDQTHPVYEKAETIRDQVYALAKLIKQLSKTTRYRIKGYTNGEALIDIGKAAK